MKAIESESIIPHLQTFADGMDGHAMSRPGVCLMMGYTLNGCLLKALLFTSDCM